MATGNVKDGDARFSRGMDSVTSLVTLPPETYCYAENILNRGGVLQTRPGYQWRFTLPPGQLQGLKVFNPRVGTPSMIAFVNGVPYGSQYPFRDYKEIAGVRMSADAKRVYTAQTTQAVERNVDLSLKFINPRSLMIVQDGVAPAAIYDGRTFVNGGSGKNKIPQGTHMAWSGARLWVSRREQLFASDIADPTSYVESTYNTLGGISYFILDDRCTGLAPLPGVSGSIQSPLLAFTNGNTSMFRSNILNRDLWPTTEDFQSTAFPNVGCVAPRSLVSHSGMLWWYSDFGLTRLNAAEASSVSSRLDFIDREMNRSAKEMSHDLSGICASNYENFLLLSIPNADLQNRDTWVFDASVNESVGEESPASWASVWTGVNPVEWTSVTVKGKTRLFCASKDADGQNRVYEAFSPERRDNGCDIPWLIETRGYTAGNLSPKALRYAEYALSELSGEVNIRVSWAGANRGPWKEMANPVFKAQEGNAVADQNYSNEEPFFGLKKQSRSTRTQDIRDIPEDTLSSAGIDGVVRTVEADKEAIDTAFQLKFEGSGPCALRSIRLFMDSVPEPESGIADTTEGEDHFVRVDGASARTEAELITAPTVFSATKTAIAEAHNFAAEATARAVSTISQEDADKRAMQIAEARAENRLREIAEPYLGGKLVDESS